MVRAAPQRVPAVIYGRTRREVLAEVNRRSRAHTLAATGQLRLLTLGPRAGWYALPIEIIAGRGRTPWRRIKLALGVATPLAALFGLGWWSVATLGAVPLLALLVAMLVSFLALVRKTQARPSTVTVTTTVTVR
jgi:hypothetical protein